MEDAVDLGLKLLSDRESQARRFRKREERDQRKQALLGFGLDLFNQHLANKADSYMENEEVYAARANQQRNYDAAQFSIKERQLADAAEGGRDSYYINKIYENIIKKSQVDYPDLEMNRFKSQTNEVAMSEARRIYEEQKPLLEEEYEAAKKIRTVDTFDKLVKQGTPPRTAKKWLLDKITGVFSNDADVRKDQEIEAIIQVSDLNYKNFEDARSALGDAGVYDLREYAEKIREIDQIDFTDWTPTGSKSASRDVYKGDGKKVTISGNLVTYVNPTNPTQTKEIFEALTPSGKKALEGHTTIIRDEEISTMYGGTYTNQVKCGVENGVELTGTCEVISTPEIPEINPKNEQYRSDIDSSLAAITDDEFRDKERKILEAIYRGNDGAYKENRFSYLADVLEVFNNPEYGSMSTREKNNLTAAIWKQHVNGHFTEGDIDTAKAGFPHQRFKENADLYILDAIWSEGAHNFISRDMSKASTKALLKNSFRDFTSLSEGQQNKLIASLTESAKNPKNEPLHYEGVSFIDALKAYKEAPEATTNLDDYLEQAKPTGTGGDAGTGGAADATGTKDVGDKPEDAAAKLPDDLSIKVNDDKEGLVISVVGTAGVGTKGLTKGMPKPFKGDWFDENFSLNMFEGDEKQRVQASIDSRATKIETLEAAILKANPGIERENIFKNKNSILRNPKTAQAYSDLDSILRTTDLPGVEFGSEKERQAKMRDFYMKHRSRVVPGSLLNPEGDQPLVEDPVPEEKKKNWLNESEIKRNTPYENKRIISEVSALFENPENAETYLSGIASTESNFGRTKGSYTPTRDKEGNAIGSVGIFQIDKIAFDEVQKRATTPNEFKKFKKNVAIADEYLKETIGVPLRELTYSDLQDDRASAVVARLLLSLDPEPIPDTKEERAKHWKKFWNTEAGAGTPEDYLERSGE